MPDNPRPPTSARAPRAMPRLGPRPLPLHLWVATTAWLNSPAALPHLRNGSLPWSPTLAPTVERLRQGLENVPDEDFAAAVAAAARRRFQVLAKGILAYRRHPYRRALAAPPAVWRLGGARLLDFGGRGRPLLVVPSLVNRAYILDLSEGRSLMRFLAGRGFRPLLMDWGAPAPDERDFTLSDYVTGRLEPALEVARGLGNGPVPVLGYCMGGLLALALALRRQGDVAGLALLATPWDFHADNPGLARATAEYAGPLMPLFERLGEMPVDALQLLFAALDPFMSVRKFCAFGRLDPDSEKAAEFVALEDWVNDGVPLSAPVARECLLGWYGENLPARGGWEIAGTPVRPERLDRPALVVVPEQDRIVPPASAAALADALPDCRRLRPAAGHIGMVVGGSARAKVWEPLADWLGACGR